MFQRPADVQRPVAQLLQRWQVDIQLQKLLRLLLLPANLDLDEQQCQLVYQSQLKTHHHKQLLARQLV